MTNRKIEIMEDLIAIQGKSVAELREIAKVLGIADEKLSKKELIARISALGANEESAEVAKDEDTIVKITSDGQNALSLTKSLLPGILKLKADTVFKEELANIAEQSSIITEYIPKDEKNYTVKCKIVEKNDFNISYSCTLFVSTTITLSSLAKSISGIISINKELSYSTGSIIVMFPMIISFG